MTPRLFCVTVIAISVLASACGRRTAALAPSASLREDETQYKQGLAAFHEGTPEGYARAADAFRKASALKPQRCDYALNLAQSLLFLSAEQLLNWEEYGPRQTEAIAVVDSTSSTCMSSYEPFLLRLRALIAGRGPTATDLINRAVDLDASDAMNWLVLGYLDPASRHLATTEGSGKRAAMAHVVELEPDSALLRYELGKNYQSLRGKESDAKRAFEGAIELSPRHFRAYLGLAYLADENVDVEPLYKKVVEIAPAFLEGRTALGSYYGAVDEIEKAAQQYMGALETNPRYDVAHFRLGLLMLQAERPGDAEKHFNAVVEFNPASYEAYYYLGNISYGRNDFAKAKDLYERALKIRLNYAEAEYGIGHVYRRQNQIHLAVAQFDKVIKMQPRFGDAYISRGDVHAERREFVDALADYEKAIDCYEEQIKSLNATIAYADARSQSPLMQSEKKRSQRDKTRVEALLNAARQYKSEVQENLRKSP